MTVKELIEELQQYDGDMVVVKENNHYDTHDLDVAVDTITININGEKVAVVNIW